MPAPDKVHELVERFDTNRDLYRRGNYLEAQARIEFINPFFRALGWDIENERGLHIGAREVIYEDTVRISGKPKAPDYGFRLDGRRVFFVEAKKPAVDLERHIDPAYQLRRYAWTAKLPVSILTDFEEFAVYDCRVRPAQGDKPTTARILYHTYNEYLDRWDDLAGLFSRDAVVDGALEQFAEAKGKRGTTAVDAEFLKEIERWRDLLARNLALRNPQLTERDLNFAVQQTIDRILFLRIAEDRGIEPYERLKGAAVGDGVYRRLMLQFSQADGRYNSGLFHFGDERDRPGHPDRMTPGLSVDDKVLRDIVRNLYYPAAPYEFSVFPAEVLGQVYEQFLGKVIRLTSAHRAVVEEKPEVRKAGGVFYTPAYIVDYIVRGTVGKLVESHKADPKGPVSRIRVLDPACGSGSFLIGAYQFLLDWHLEGYRADTAKWSKGRGRTLHQTAGGDWVLTLDERKRILLDNIYGVDIDPQAVEVTKLSLLLKVLEGEAGAVSGQLALLPERVLPDLGRNIKCGNSLIGPDLYSQMALFGDGDVMRINAFDWRAEFPQVAAAGGFDAVIGNPPYIRIQALKEWAPIEVEFYKRRYRAASKGNYDIYVVFVEKALELLNDRGRLGYILPHKFFNAKYGEPLRGIIAEGKHLSQVVHFADQQVFSGATTYTCLMFLDKSGRDEFRYVDARDLAAWRLDEAAIEGNIAADRVTEKEWNYTVQSGAPLFSRLQQMPVRLGDVSQIFVGLQTSADKIYVLKEVQGSDVGTVKLLDRNNKEWSLEREMLRPFLNKVTVATYERPIPRHWLIFPYRLTDVQSKLMPASEISRNYPNTWEYLKENERDLRNRESGKANTPEWYGYIYKKNLTSFDHPKLIVQVISLFGRYAYDNSAIYFSGGGNGPYYGVRWLPGYEPHSNHYLQAILSSPVLDFYLRQVSTNFRGGYWSYGKRFIEQLPIRTIDFTKPEDAARHARIVELVERMLDLHKRLAAETNPQMKTAMQRQIDATDAQIDSLVYELYGLTDEEIGIVDGQ